MQYNMLHGTSLLHTIKESIPELFPLYQKFFPFVLAGVLYVYNNQDTQFFSYTLASVIGRNVN